MLEIKKTRHCLPDEYSSVDLVFESEINKAIKETEEHYTNMRFGEAIKTGFHDLQV